MLPSRPDRTTALAVALVLVLALAGCSQLGGQRTSTLTPAPIPAEPASPDRADAATSEIVSDTPGPPDAASIVAVHRSVVRNVSFTALVRAENRDPNGTTVAAYTRVVESGEGDVYRSTTVGESGGVPGHPDAERVERYTEGDRTLLAVTDDGTTSYRRATPNPPVSARLYAVLSAVELNATQVRSGRRVQHRLSSERPSGTVQVDLGDENLTMWNASVVVLVERGVVREYWLRYTTTVDGREVRHVRRVRFTTFRDTVVRRPAWYETALDRVTNGTATPTPE